MLARGSAPCRLAAGLWPEVVEKASQKALAQSGPGFRKQAARGTAQRHRANSNKSFLVISQVGFVDQIGSKRLDSSVFTSAIAADGATIGAVSHVGTG